LFDNIPLTALALTKNGFDWGLLAFAVGFAGSIMLSVFGWNAASLPVAAH
jgi:hypothetical protein